MQCPLLVLTCTCCMHSHIFPGLRIKDSVLVGMARLRVIACIDIPQPLDIPYHYILLATLPGYSVRSVIDQCLIDCVQPNNNWIKGTKFQTVMIIILAEEIIYVLVLLMVRMQNEPSTVVVVENLRTRLDQALHETLG